MRVLDSAIGGIIGSGIGWLFLSKQFSIWGYRENGWLFATLTGLTIGLVLGYALSPSLRARSDRRLVSPYGMLISVLAIFLWIIPMGMTGSFKSKLYTVPAFVRNQYRISCLFTHSSKHWHTVHYEVRLQGQLNWEEGPLEGFFDLDIFGYRSKLNRIVLASRYKDKQGNISGRNKKRFEELAEFIGTRWGELHDTDPKVKEVRFYRVGHTVGEKHCMARDAWSRPPLSSIPEGKRDLLITVPLDEI